MAASEFSGRKNSSTQLLEELEELSQSLYQTHTATTRRTASLAIPRASVPALTSVDEARVEVKSASRIRSRRLSLSPWRSRPKPDDENQQNIGAKALNKQETKLFETEASAEKKGIWKWKPIRALTHIGMQKLSCLFSVEVVAVQGLPASMNGLRLAVCIRKKETKDGAVNTMPSRVSQGAADFEETLFVKCHVYCTPGQGRQLKFEPRPFWIYPFAVDAEELDFGRGSVDLSHLIQESMDKSQEGTRVRQWDTSFILSGKANGGELVLKLGFQIMEKDGGIDIYSQADGFKSGKSRNSSSFRHKQSKTSFSVPSPRMTSRTESWTPSQTKAAADLQGMDELNLDEPASELKESEPEPNMEELELPDFEVVEKGIEIEERNVTGSEDSEENVETKSTSSEVVKEIIHDQLHLTRLTELDAIAEQIKALEHMMADEEKVKLEDETESQTLDADEETVTREFLQMLEGEEVETYKFSQPEIPKIEEAGDSTEADSVYLSDLGKGLGCVVQTRNGGYLASMNPLDTVVSRKDTPKLAMQLSKPVIIPSQKPMSGVELFQRMAAAGFEELSSQILSLMPMDELIGKTAEQIAFEGIASAIIQGRNKEIASSSAARTIASVKTMATAMNTGRKERITTGIWNVDEKPLELEDVLAFALPKIEAMSIEAMKIQAEMTEQEAPFDVSPLSEPNHPLAAAIPIEDWIKTYSSSTSGESETITVAVVVQLRDPLRRYEAVGGPVIALIRATCIDTKEEKYEEEKKFKVESLHVGGLKGETKRSVWDTERQRLTAMQWLVAFGQGKGGKRAKQALTKGQHLLWSMSSRVMANMWLKPMRNPDVKFLK